MGPLEAQPILLKPLKRTSAGAHPYTWLSLLKSRAWRCGTRVHRWALLPQNLLYLANRKNVNFKLKALTSESIN